MAIRHEIIDEQVGDYQTVTFRATEVAAAAQWLRDNGLSSTRPPPHMEPYVDANMAPAKLVLGAGISSIKPLRVAPVPMIPLVLTAVAAEPHLTVTAFVTDRRPAQSHPVAPSIRRASPRSQRPQQYPGAGLPSTRLAATASPSSTRRPAPPRRRHTSCC
jgi:hypothetical protein